MTTFPLQAPATIQAEIARALAIVSAVQAKALAAFMAGDVVRSQALEARAARVERFADTKARGWW